MKRHDGRLRMCLVTALLTASCLASASRPAVAAEPGGNEPGGYLPGSPGAVTNPIAVAGIEALAPRGEALSARDAYPFRLGPFLAALHGARGEALPSRYGVVMDGDARPATSDSYVGGALELGTPETGSLSVEVGRVTPRDPVSVALLGDTDEPYWATSLALGIRF